MFDVNAEKIHCSHCNKEIGRDDKFIFTHYLSFNPYINHISGSKGFCCIECAKLNDSSLETFINDMAVKHYKSHMYSPNSILHIDDIDEETERPRIAALSQALNSIVDKYNAHGVFIEINTTLNELKERQEEQMKD